jgi:hypothetical protein
MEDKPNLKTGLWFSVSAKNKIILNQLLKKRVDLQSPCVALVRIAGQPFITTPYMH